MVLISLKFQVSLGYAVSRVLAPVPKILIEHAINTER